MKKAFTLIELMVVITLIGVMAAFVFPRFLTRKPKFDWRSVLNDVNILVAFSRQEAIASQKIHRIVFKSNPRGRDVVFVQIAEDSLDDPTKIIYKPVRSSYFDAKYEPEIFVEFISFFIGKEEQFEDNKGRANCYILPDGLVQDVTIHLQNKKAKYDKQVTFRMQPFQGQFLLLDGFIKPSQDRKSYVE